MNSSAFLLNSLILKLEDKFTLVWAKNFIFKFTKILNLEKNNFGFENSQILIIQKFYDKISQNFESKQLITTKQVTMNDPHMKGPLESKSEVKDNKIWVKAPNGQDKWAFKQSGV